MVPRAIRADERRCLSRLMPSVRPRLLVHGAPSDYRPHHHSRQLSVLTRRTRPAPASLECCHSRGVDLLTGTRLFIRRADCAFHLCAPCCRGALLFQLIRVHYFIATLELLLLSSWWRVLATGRSFNRFPVNLVFMGYISYELCRYGIVFIFLFFLFLLLENKRKFIPLFNLLSALWES